MNKIVLSLTLLLLSLNLSDAQSIKIAENLSRLKCKTHNSKKCVTVEGFENELNAKCASESGNCRYVFCKENCADSNTSGKVGLCRTHCFSPKLLARFSARKRESFYMTSFVGVNHKSLSPADKYDLAMQALQTEGKVRKLKSGKILNSSAKQEDRDLYNFLDVTVKQALKELQTPEPKNTAIRQSKSSLYSKLVSRKNIMLQHLSSTYPPKTVRALIEDALKQGVKPEEIVLAFDFDGTLSTKGNKPGTTVLRGGQEFLDFLNWAKESGVNLLVDTAAGSGALETLATQSKLSGVGHIFYLNDEHFKTMNNGSKVFMKDKMLNDKTFVKVGNSEEIVAISNNFVTGERSGYNKPHYLKAYLDKKGIRPRLVIFLDDGAVNVVNMKLTFPQLMPDVPLLAIHVPQLEKMTGFYGFLANAEQFKEVMLQELKNPELNGVTSSEKIIMAGNNLAQKSFPNEKEPEPGEAGNAALIAYLNLRKK